MTRKLVPFGAAIMLALAVVTISRLTGSPGLTYALAGFVAAVLLIVGTRFAFGYGLLKDRNRMQSDEPAVAAYEQHGREASPPNGDRPLFIEDLEEDRLLWSSPAIMAARGTGAMRVAVVKRSAEAIEVGHQELTILSSRGSDQ